MHMRSTKKELAQNVKRCMTSFMPPEKPSNIILLYQVSNYQSIIEEGSYGFIRKPICLKSTRAVIRQERVHLSDGQCKIRTRNYWRRTLPSRARSPLRAART